MSADIGEIVGTPLVSDRERRKLQSDPKSFSKNAWEQTVTDKEGRRRFHGAFTGGFSAGYFNTVGSKEGWQPQAFSSSRTNRAQTVRQRPEDFMDEDDDPMLGRSLHAKPAFDTLGTHSTHLARQAVQREAQASRAIIPGAVPDELVVAQRNSVGMRLMESMGWRPGHGVGPLQKVGLSGRRVHEDGRVTVDPHAAGMKFAPRNTRVQAARAKVDSFGVGFVPASNFALKPGGAEALKGRKGRLGMSGGIGTSVLEDDDDIEVYAEDDPSKYAFGAQRFVSERKALRDKPSEQLVAVHGPFPGFCLAQDSERIEPYKFEEIDVPDGFVPKHVFPKDSYAPTEAFTSMTPQDRAFALGEKQMKSESVFNLLSEESKAKLQRAVAQRNKPPPTAASRVAEGALASRFVPEQAKKQTKELTPGLRAPDLKALEAPKQRSEKAKVGRPPQLNFTRITMPWNPDRILCKRFNVPVPEVKQLPLREEKGTGQMLKDAFQLREKTSSKGAGVELVQVSQSNMSLFKEIFEKTGEDEAESFDESSSDEDAEDLKGGRKTIQKEEMDGDEATPPQDAFHSSVRFLSRAEREKARGVTSTKPKTKKKIVSHRNLFSEEGEEQKTTIIQEQSEHTEESLPDWVRSAMASEPSSRSGREKDHRSKSRSKKKKKKSEKKHHKKKKKKDRS